MTTFSADHMYQYWQDQMMQLWGSSHYNHFWLLRIKIDKKGFMRLCGIHSKCIFVCITFLIYLWFLEIQPGLAPTHYTSLHNCISVNIVLFIIFIHSTLKYLLIWQLPISMEYSRCAARSSGGGNKEGSPPHPVQTSVLSCSNSM